MYIILMYVYVNIKKLYNRNIINFVNIVIIINQLDEFFFV